MMDSLIRFPMAQREIGLTIEEILKKVLPLVSTPYWWRATIPTDPSLTRSAASWTDTLPSPVSGRLQTPPHHRSMVSISRLMAENGYKILWECTEKCQPDVNWLQTNRKLYRKMAESSENVFAERRKDDIIVMVF